MRSPLDPNLPTSTYSITAGELARMPIVDTQDALQYAPNAMVHKLRIGDTIGGIDPQLNGALNHARIVENRVLPASEGKVLPGEPKVRASALASYRTGPWLASLGLRHEGRTYGQLDNSDINPATFGGSNEASVVDAKVGYRIADGATASLGVNNLNNYHYYQTHPYAGRVVYVELNARF